jgi:hypothetical protein
MVTDHKQQYNEDSIVSEKTPQSIWRAHEQARVRMRQEIFPGLNQDAIIFANFNQLYKIDPVRSTKYSGIVMFRLSLSLDGLHGLAPNT